MFSKILISILFGLCMINKALADTNAILQKLDSRMKSSNSLVCVGLDPDLSKMPEEFKNHTLTVEDNVYNFLTEVVDITATHVTAYKIQKAFFDYFQNGHLLLKKTVAYIHNKYSDIPVFIDCKIGDTENTMKTYMTTLFDDIKVDAVVINPYMGDDVLEPFMLDKNKTAIVLVQTSNPNAKVVQELRLENGKLLWEEVLNLVVNKWNINHNLIPVLSSNTGYDNYSSIRQKIPADMPILLAGVGSQGGNPKVMKQLLNKNKRGVFVNSSRGILYPYDPQDKEWKNHILQAVLNLKATLNEIKNLA